MNTQAAANDMTKVKIRRSRTPLWRRITSVVSLGSLIVIVGVAIAAVVGATALMMFVLLEQAVG